MGVGVIGCNFFCQGAVVQETFSGGGGKSRDEGAGCKPIFPICSIFKRLNSKFVPICRVEE